MAASGCDIRPFMVAGIHGSMFSDQLLDSEANPVANGQAFGVLCKDWGGIGKEAKG